MKKSELKALIREVVEEQTLNREALSKKAIEVIEFLRDNESQITDDPNEKQVLRRCRGYLEDVLTDEDYKILHPGSNIGKVGGSDREDFARGT